MRVSPIARLRRWTRLCLTTFAVLTGTAAPALAQPVPAVTEYYHLDALGSTRVVTSQTGAVLRHYEFGPFGGQDSPCTQSPDKRLFTGQVRDKETCLDYFGARHMRSTFGRFLTIDPALDIGAALVDPQQWNRYAYARNNPMKFVDPDGKEIAVKVGNRFVGVGLETVAPSAGNGNREFAILAGVATAAILGPVVVQAAWSYCVVNPIACTTAVAATVGGGSSVPAGSANAAKQAASFAVNLANRRSAIGNIVFQTGHGGRHLEGTSLNVGVVERAIAQGITSLSERAHLSGNFWGWVNVGGKTIEYRAWIMKDGTVRVGSYYIPE
jgi:RHS repeat-associated protein